MFHNRARYAWKRREHNLRVRALCDQGMPWFDALRAAENAYGRKWWEREELRYIKAERRWARRAGRFRVKA